MNGQNKQRKALYFIFLFLSLINFFLHFIQTNISKIRSITKFHCRFLAGIRKRSRTTSANYPAIRTAPFRTIGRTRTTACGGFAPTAADRGGGRIVRQPASNFHEDRPFITIFAEERFRSDGRSSWIRFSLVSDFPNRPNYEETTFSFDAGGDVRAVGRSTNSIAAAARNAGTRRRGDTARIDPFRREVRTDPAAAARLAGP